MAKRLRIKMDSCPALTITRSANRADKLVYVAVCDRSLQYRHGRSRIAYFGTTKNGADRIASSAAFRGKELLGLHGVRQVEFFVVTCRAKQNVTTWKKLERALLLAFRDRFGSVPRCNDKGKKMQWRDERNEFSLPRLQSVISRYSEP